MSQTREKLSSNKLFKFQIAYNRARLQEEGIAFTEFSLNLPTDERRIELGLTQFNALSYSNSDNQIAHVFRCGEGVNAVNHVICYPGVDNENVHTDMPLEEIATVVDILLQSKAFKSTCPGTNKTYFTAMVFAKSALNEDHFVAITPSENPTEHMIINPKGRQLAWMTNPDSDYLKRFLTLKAGTPVAIGIQRARNKEDCGRFCAAIHYEAIHAANAADLLQKVSAIRIEDIIEIETGINQQEAKISANTQSYILDPAYENESDDDVGSFVYTDAAK